MKEDELIKVDQPIRAVIEEIYIAIEGGAAMQRLEQVQALVHRGLQGDRYCERRGHWSGIDECQVTLIEEEYIEEIAATTVLRVRNGEHRRNLITRHIRLETLVGKQFQVGKAIFEYDRPRPPCGYVQSITERGLTKALMGRSGICARVVKSGLLRGKDPIVVL